jgi:hypothetical protein
MCVQRKAQAYVSQYRTTNQLCVLYAAVVSKQAVGKGSERWLWCGPNSQKGCSEAGREFQQNVNSMLMWTSIYWSI